MAQFYAEIQGNRGEATRMGTKNSGMYCHTRGWHNGVKVLSNHYNGEDEHQIFLTSGSTANKLDIFLGVLKEDKFTPSGWLIALVETMEGKDGTDETV